MFVMPYFHSVYWVGNYRPVLGCSVLALHIYEGVERCLSCPIFTLCVGSGITDRFLGVVFLPSLIMKELRDVCHALFSLCLLGWELQTGFRV